MNFGVVGFGSSAGSFALGLLLPIFVFTGVARFSEARWGRRGLLIAWLVSAVIVPIIMYASSLPSFDEPFGADAMMSGLIFGIPFVFYLAAFGASALVVSALSGCEPRITGRSFPRVGR